MPLFNLFHFCHSIFLRICNILKFMSWKLHTKITYFGFGSYFLTLLWYCPTCLHFFFFNSASNPEYLLKATIPKTLGLWGDFKMWAMCSEILCQDASHFLTQGPNYSDTILTKVAWLTAEISCFSFPSLKQSVFDLSQFFLLS
jgi:hypothetical protein